MGSLKTEKKNVTPVITNVWLLPQATCLTLSPFNPVNEQVHTVKTSV